MFDLTITKNFSIAGKSFSHAQTISTDELANSLEAEIPVALAGVLTVRTDANTGSLTMDSVSHGLIATNKIDLYWDNADGTSGQRRNVTVGVVAGAVVAIDLGAGDDLPIATTVIQAALVQVYTVSIIGDDIATLLGTVDFAKGTIVLLDTGGTVECLYMEIIAGGSYDWLGAGTNPIATKTIDTIHMTHNDVGTARFGRVISQLADA